MNNFIYEKLAVTNLKNNRKTYVPYIFTGVLTVMMFYIIDALSRWKGITQDTLKICLQYATGVIVVFAVIFLFYTNSFLIKRRKKEIGVYNILGMGKRHIARMMAVETILTAGISILGGLVFGIIFGKLMYLLLLKILHNSVDMQFSVNGTAIVQTVILFAGIFLLTYLYNILQIQLVNPVELLHGGNQGEKEPKSRWLLVIVGVAALGNGYWIALTTEAPLEALLKFFVAVVCVIIGTYALFIAGSIVVLKILRKNKAYYYNPKHFTSVSGMIYRMKQNGAGLANICVLSTMVLVMVSTTVSLYAGMEDILDSRFPRDVSIVCNEADTNKEETLQRLIKEQCEKAGVKITDRVRYRYGSMNAVLKGNNLEKVEQYYPDNHFYYVEMITQEEYNRIEKKNVSLKGQEILTYTTNGKCGKKEINIAGRNYQVKKELSEMTSQPKSTAEMYKTLYIVFANAEQIERIEPFSYADKFNLKGDDGKQKEALEQIQNEFYEKIPDGMMESRMLSRSSFYELYGGLFFIGIYLGSMFIMATVLIIYYKQISEGYDDRERYQIMQKVGMSKKEVKRSIRSQVLSVFFLPLVVAVIHVAVAFKVMTKILGVLNLTNVSLFAVCTIITIAVFAVFYIIVYSITAKEYYRIVN
ncbi:ABC transporter permease [Dorea longicatena]|uniref:ABC transporter permease n=1 Tax=Dorea longicatena TaxID=88431 RepID=A0A414S0H0_9FIRM|nr:ABC transporter permease [Dorea longicatena]RHG06742.1 ABC transporter permease [Dorea longicatena]